MLDLDKNIMQKQDVDVCLMGSDELNRLLDYAFAPAVGNSSPFLTNLPFHEFP